MNYDKILVELLNRICELEDKVKTLEEKINIMSESNIVKVSTEDVRKYISSLKENAASKGESYLILVANDIHNALELKSRMPIVCNAMKQSMSDRDEILHQTASGYSSTLTIKYNL